MLIVAFDFCLDNRHHYPAEVSVYVNLMYVLVLVCFYISKRNEESFFLNLKGVFFLIFLYFKFICWISNNSMKLPGLNSTHVIFLQSFATGVLNPVSVSLRFIQTVCSIFVVTLFMTFCRISSAFATQQKQDTVGCTGRESSVCQIKRLLEYFLSC